MKTRGEKNNLKKELEGWILVLGHFLMENLVGVCPHSTQWFVGKCLTTGSPREKINPGSRCLLISKVKILYHSWFQAADVTHWKQLGRCRHSVLSLLDGVDNFLHYSLKLSISWLIILTITLKGQISIGPRQGTTLVECHFICLMHIVHPLRRFVEHVPPCQMMCFLF